MPKYIGVDVGTKRVGIAVSDVGGKIAFPFEVVRSRDAVARILEIYEEEGAEGVVFGESRTADGEANKVMAEIEAFKDMIEEEGIEVFLEDESFTTAHVRMAGMGENIDAGAAALILQRFLDKRREEA